MSTFTSILEKKGDEIKRPPNPPTGHYRWEVTNPAVERVTEDGSWGIIEIPVKAVSAQADVDETLLEEFGRPVESIVNRVSFVFSMAEDSEGEASRARGQFYLKEFTDKLGLDFKGPESLKERLSQIVGAHFVGQLTNKVDKNNPDITRSELNRTISLEDMPEAI